MKKLLLLGIPLVTLAGLNVWSQAVAEPAHIRGPGVVVRDGTGPDPAATRAPASGAVREPAPVSPAPSGATGPLDRITVLVPAIPATISTPDASDDDGGSRGRGRGGKSEGSRSGHQGGRDDS